MDVIAATMLKRTNFFLEIFALFFRQIFALFFRQIFVLFFSRIFRQIFAYSISRKFSHFLRANEMQKLNEIVAKKKHDFSLAGNPIVE